MSTETWRLRPTIFLPSSKLRHSPRCRRLDGLAVENAGKGARLATRLLAVDHHGEVVDCVEQQQPHHASEPSVDGRPRWEVFASMRQQHPVQAKYLFALSTFEGQCAVADRCGPVSEANVRPTTAPRPSGPSGNTSSSF